jgi:FkbH-like protein
VKGEADKAPMELAAALERWPKALPSRVAMARLFDVAQPSLAAAMLRQWNASGLAKSDQWPAHQRVHVGLGGFGTLHYLAGPVCSAILADGAVPQVTVGQYNQLFQDLSRPQSDLTAPGVEVVWIWADLPDLLPSAFTQNPAALASEAGLKAAEEALNLLTGALHQARGRTSALFLVNDFIPRRRSPLGITDGARWPSFEGVYHFANQMLAQKLSQIPSTYVYPLGHCLGRFGLGRAEDSRLRLLADCPFRPEFLFEAAQGLRPYLRAIKGASRKVLVLDLDNTLWGGVVGEDGWDGVRIGAADPVSKAFTRFHHAVRELYERGVILAINSRNNPEDVREIFQRRQDMVLKLTDFASVQMNWQDKVSNCRAIAKELNVGLDSLVFWDDNPAERELIRQAAPEVYVVEVSPDPSNWADRLMEFDLFDGLKITEEDRERGKMYAEDRLRREAAVVATDWDSFLEHLQLHVRCVPACDENIPRIVSLLARTNQFNLSTKRHSEPLIRQWAGQPEWRILTYAAEDRFGSYGIVGVTILRRDDSSTEIDSLLLSCRAMGKGVEEVMLWQAAQQARAWGHRRLRGAYAPTRKNAPIKMFLPDHGFVSLGKEDGIVVYELDLLTANLPPPRHVRIAVQGQ